MPERFEKDSGSSHYILGSLLFIIGLLVLILIINLRSRADDSSTQVTLNNTAPVVDTLTFSETSQGASIDNFTVNENTTKPLYIYGTYHDDNGCADVNTLGFVLYGGSSVGGTGCSYNDTNCYNQNSTGYTCNFTSVGSNTCDGGTDTTADYVCSVPVQFFADATDDGPYSGNDWVARVSATDASTSTGYYDSGILTFYTLSALDVGSSINYGSLGLSSTSPSSIPLAITNTGNNNALDVNVSGTNMSCTVGSIPVGNQHYSTASAAPYGSMTALTGSPELIDFNIVKATSAGTPSDEDLYWQLQVPSSGLSGSCAGTSTFSAIQF